MVKNLGYYVIPETFKHNLRDWQDMDINKIIDDFYKLTSDLGLNINLDYGADWQEDEGLWDLMLYHEGDFRGYIGNFYITWRKDINWDCSNIWFSGFKVNDDSDQAHWSWNNK